MKEGLKFGAAMGVGSMIVEVYNRWGAVAQDGVGELFLSLGFRFILFLVIGAVGYMAYDRLTGKQEKSL